MRMGLTTVRTAAPRTWSPAVYFLCGSSQRTWKSVTFLLRPRSGRVRGRLRRDKKPGLEENVEIEEDDVEGLRAEVEADADRLATALGEEDDETDADADVDAAAGVVDRRPLPRDDAGGMGGVRAIRRRSQSRPWPC